MWWILTLKEREPVRFIWAPIWCWWALETVSSELVCLPTENPGRNHHPLPPVSKNIAKKRSGRCTESKWKMVWMSPSVSGALSSPWAPPASCSNASSSASADRRWSGAPSLAPPVLSGKKQKCIPQCHSEHPDVLHKSPPKLKWLPPCWFWPRPLSFHFCRQTPAVFFPSAVLCQPTITGTRPLWSPAVRPEEKWKIWLIKITEEKNNSKLEKGFPNCSKRVLKQLET